MVILLLIVHYLLLLPLCVCACVHACVCVCVCGGADWSRLAYFNCTVKPRKFKTDFTKYSLIRNKFGKHLIQRTGLIYDIF